MSSMLVYLSDQSQHERTPVKKAVHCIRLAVVSIQLEVLLRVAPIAQLVVWFRFLALGGRLRRLPS